jgi:hypothetical protein
LNKTYSATIRKTFKTIDWKLLIFLLLFLNVKLVIKLAALVYIYFLQPDFKFNFRFRKSRLPLFYPLIIGIALLDYFITSGFSFQNYSAVFLIGICFWLFSILAIHQVKLFVESNDPAVTHRTIYVFFIINALVSIIAFLLIAYETKTINPYLYQGQYQKYFIGTGDYIKGISFDTSTTNGLLNAFGVIYFLQTRKTIMVFLFMIILLMTGSNITNILLCLVLVSMFVFQSDKDQKSVIVICFFFLIMFMAKISPQNNNYLVASFNNIFDKEANVSQKNITQAAIKISPDSILTIAERKQKTAMLYLDSISLLQWEKQKLLGIEPIAVNERLLIPVDNINAPEFQHKSFVTPVEENMFQFIAANATALPMSSDSTFKPKYPGKIIAWEQTINYFKQHPSKLITGLGVGNFSSKLAFKASGLKVAGAYPEKYKYISLPFLTNHLDLYLYFFSKADGLHSIINNPASVYDQLLSEYGLLGLSAFFIFYVGFFIGKIKLLSYGIPLLLLLTGILFFDYWFEQLSIIIFFELLMFLNVKEKAYKL